LRSGTKPEPTPSEISSTAPALTKDTAAERRQAKDKLPWAGTDKGKQEIANFFAQVEQTLEFTEFTPREMIEQGDTVVVLGTLAGRAKSRHGSCHAENQVDYLILAHRGHSTKK
jgi:ketosteroid isomerase-like protein